MFFAEFYQRLRKSYKLLIMGASGVGKTIFLGSYFYATNQGNKEGKYSIQVARKNFDTVRDLTDTLFKSVPEGTSQRVDMNFSAATPKKSLRIRLTDNPGGITTDPDQWGPQEIEKELRAADGAVFFLSADDICHNYKAFSDSIMAFKTAISEIRSKKGGRDVPIFIVFTKCDLIRNELTPEGTPVDKEYLLKQAGVLAKVSGTSKKGKYDQSFMTTALGQWLDVKTPPRESDYCPENVIEPMDALIDAMVASHRAYDRKRLLRLCAGIALLYGLFWGARVWWPEHLEKRAFKDLLPYLSEAESGKLPDPYSPLFSMGVREIRRYRESGYKNRGHHDRVNASDGYYKLGAMFKRDFSELSGLENFLAELNTFRADRRSGWNPRWDSALTKEIARLITVWSNTQSFDSAEQYEKVLADMETLLSGGLLQGELCREAREYLAFLSARWREECGRLWAREIDAAIDEAQRSDPPEAGAERILTELGRNALPPALREKLQGELKARYNMIFDLWMSHPEQYTLKYIREKIFPLYPKFAKESFREEHPGKRLAAELLDGSIKSSANLTDLKRTWDSVEDSLKREPEQRRVLAETFISLAQKELRLCEEEIRKSLLAREHGRAKELILSKEADIERCVDQYESGIRSSLSPVKASLGRWRLQQCRAAALAEYDILKTEEFIRLSDLQDHRPAQPSGSSFVPAPPQSSLAGETQREIQEEARILQDVSGRFRNWLDRWASEAAAIPQYEEVKGVFAFLEKLVKGEEIELTLKVSVRFRGDGVFNLIAEQNGVPLSNTQINPENCPASESERVFVYSMKWTPRSSPVKLTVRRTYGFFHLNDDASLSLDCDGVRGIRRLTTHIPLELGESSVSVDCTSVPPCAW